MDIQTFSTTYWYIWFLMILLIVILLLLNGVGMLLYHKKRKKFLNQTNINDNIPMREASTISTINANKSKYRKMSIPSTISNISSLRHTVSDLPFSITNFEQTRNSILNITPIPEILENAQLQLSSDEINEKTNDIDLLLNEFQQQALHEHNSIRTMYNKPQLQLNESLNIYAQHWAEQCARTNIIEPSSLEWRLRCNGEPLGENIISVKSINTFDGVYFTSLLMANGNQSDEVDCILNEISTDVGFGRAQTQPDDDSQPKQWIGVAYYYPYRQLTIVQS